MPKSVIGRFAREVAEQFQPEKIILFGSHAYGKPNADSDVDILDALPERARSDVQSTAVCGIAPASISTRSTP